MISSNVNIQEMFEEAFSELYNAYGNDVQGRNALTDSFHLSEPYTGLKLWAAEVIDMLSPRSEPMLKTAILGSVDWDELSSYIGGEVMDYMDTDEYLQYAKAFPDPPGI